MKHERKLLSAILRKSDLPRELDRHRFWLEWIGNDEITIEQHRGILCFSDDTIRFSTEQGVLAVCGSALCLEHLSDTSAKVLGSITSVSIEAKS